MVCSPTPTHLKWAIGGGGVYMAPTSKTNRWIGRLHVLRMHLRGPVVSPRDPVTPRVLVVGSTVRGLETSMPSLVVHRIFLQVLLQPSLDRRSSGHSGAHHQRVPVCSSSLGHFSRQHLKFQCPRNPIHRRILVLLLSCCPSILSLNCILS